MNELHKHTNPEGTVDQGMLDADVRVDCFEESHVTGLEALKQVDF